MEMIAAVFKYLTPFVYWLLIIFWAFIFSFYFKRIRQKRYNDLMLRTLFVILSIDSLRTLFESSYFGLWYTSLSGLIPIGIFNFLAQPQVVFFPKITNLLVSIIIIFILIRKWIPKEDERLKQMKSDILTFETAFNQSPICIVITDINGNIEYVNKKTCELTGYTELELKGRNPRLLGSGITKKEIYEDLWKTIRSGGAWKGLFHNKKKNGDFYWEDALISPIHNDDGEITHFIATKEDITEKLKIQEQLHHRDKMNAIGQLAGGIAHDYNNVITGIMNSAQLLKMKNKDLNDRSQRYIDLILQSSMRASELSNRLLIFSRKKNEGYVPLDLHKIIVDVHNLVINTIDKKVELILSLNAEKSLIEGNNTELHSALLNLCINSSHAMPDGGTIHITTGNSVLDVKHCKASKLEIKAGSYCWIEVTDSGTGIPDEVMDKIFEPFFTTKQSGEGSGLGLSAVYKMVENHHGTIEVKSQLEAGTTFKIFIPISSDKPAIKEDLMLTDVDLNSARDKTILLIDDEETNQIVIGDMIKALGYDVLIASDGHEALKLYSENHIYVVVLDMIMPKLNGYETLAELRKIDPLCKVIISTGYSDSKNIDRVSRMGVSGILHKPFKVEELIDLIQNI